LIRRFEGYASVRIIVLDEAMSRVQFVLFEKVRIFEGIVTEETNNDTPTSHHQRA
jgi:coenzyme F420-reducing hydrogenase alpha subunit